MSRLEVILLALLVAGCSLIVAGVNRWSSGAAMIVAGWMLVAFVGALVRHGALRGDG